MNGLLPTLRYRTSSKTRVGSLYGDVIWYKNADGGRTSDLDRIRRIGMSSSGGERELGGNPVIGDVICYDGKE